MPHWIVAQTIARRENVAARYIVNAGLEVFDPKVSMHGRIVALFPGYLFVRIVDHWRIVAKTAGVLSLIMSGEKPARCPEREIDKIKAMMHNGLVRLPLPKKTAPFTAGQDVRIVSGPFCGFDAIYDGMNKHERECVLLEILGRKVRVEIASSDDVARAPLVSTVDVVYQH